LKNAKPSFWFKCHITKMQNTTVSKAAWPGCANLCLLWGPFLTSPLAPRGEICLLGVNTLYCLEECRGEHPQGTNSPLGSKFAPRGEVKKGPLVTLLLILFWTITDVAQKCVLPFSEMLCTYFDKEWVGPHFGPFFHKQHLVTLINSLFPLNCGYCSEMFEAGVCKHELPFALFERSSFSIYHLQMCCFD
jgi:hypothetical protein